MIKMAWQQIINGIDQDLPPTSRYDSPNTGGDIDRFAGMVGIDRWAGWNEEFESRMREHWVSFWLCTDKIAGYSVFFLDRVPVAVGIQHARKEGKYIMFLSQSAFDSVRKAVLECLDEDDRPHVPLVDVNAVVELPELVPGSYGYQRFEKPL